MMLTKAAILLGSKGPPQALAHAVNAKLRTVESWVRGERIPGPVARLNIQGVWPDIAPELWEEAAPGSRGGGLEVAPTPGSATPDALASEADRLLADATTLRKRVLADPGATPMQAATALAKAAEVLAKAGRLVGYGVTEREILRSPKWVEVCGAMIAALEPWPDAMAAVVAALEAQGVAP